VPDDRHARNGETGVGESVDRRHRRLERLRRPWSAVDRSIVPAPGAMTIAAADRPIGAASRRSPSGIARCVPGPTRHPTGRRSTGGTTMIGTSHVARLRKTTALAATIAGTLGVLGPLAGAGPALAKHGHDGPAAEHQGRDDGTPGDRGRGHDGPSQRGRDEGGPAPERGDDRERGHRHGGPRPVTVKVFAPERGDNAGAGGLGWLVDMELEVHHKNLQQTGFSGFQLTGPGVHANADPFPGLFAPGKDDRMPGVVVLDSTTSATLPGFSGPGTNLANLFNVSGITNRTGDDTELWDTWIVGAPIAGLNVDSVLNVAVVDDLDDNGVYDDAPDVVADANHDGRIDGADLEAMGVASNVVTVPFRINGDPA